ncbi:oxidoreductase, aldo/keto reductase family protein [Leptospira fainei serovar Hurstbridge str. BUT 6]|uniref:Oxidoreductase, aldo/keto reductase family protein n=1 Tax=Leptospira fainei serovar Hurstbridge str. BUT 6 TaxID=1193011 RepID=S3UUY0_9LEPT|nr:aldo/keto reductase [Leptospira fainei]EPG74221.1 oxidoreductase, aldo/keto reductase family protein [Leptospira fainei serovar Hurstbridge str. BUT 6]
MIPSISLTEGGPALSRLVFGCWRLHLDPQGFGAQRILEKIEFSLELGIYTFDHADIYGEYQNQEHFGKALRLKPGLKDSITIVTKCGIQVPGARHPGIHLKHYNTSEEHILESIDSSLGKLGVEKIDLLLIHRPDFLMDADSVASAFFKLRASGKAMHFGVSNFTPSQFQLLQSRLNFPLVTNQVEFHPLHPSPLTDGTFDQAQELRFRPMVWSPTAGGRIFSHNGDREVAVRDALEQLAKDKGVSADAVLYAWFLLHPAGILPVLGTNQTNRLRSAAEAFRIHLTKEEWYRIWAAGAGHSIP